MSAIKNPGETVGGSLSFFSQEELLLQQCLLLEDELAVKGGGDGLP